jgi:hypothetical protein
MAKGLLYQKLERLIAEDDFLKDIREDQLAQRVCNRFRLNKKEAKFLFGEIKLKRINRIKVARR